MGETKEQIRKKAKQYIDFLHSKGLQSYVDEFDEIGRVQRAVGYLP